MSYLPFIQLKLKLKILSKIEKFIKLGPGNSNENLKLGSIIPVLEI